tara:strand:- start:6 stop:830 length:825 start_codon:yes stop_codon:yes gene_type:complete
MICAKWNENKSRNKYIQLCKQALEDDFTFNNIKSHPNYSMVEKANITYKLCGEWLLNVYFNNYPNMLHFLEYGIDNDKYCNPTKFDYSYLLQNRVKLSTYNMSFCCISYVVKALNIITHMKNIDINKYNIVEIGGGYGGQAYILFKISKDLNIDIESYSIFDIKYPSMLQQKYINLVKLNEICNINTYYDLNIDKNISDKFNFVISNYALSEISTKIQDVYFKKILYNVKHGFILWNFLNRENINPYFERNNININTREECNPNILKNSLEIKY